MSVEIKYQICTKTVLDTTIPGISFNSVGECVYCDYYHKLAKKTINRNSEILKKEFDCVIEIIKTTGNGKPYDCVLGISGGLDSTYLALLAKEKGLRPLLVHFDNGWNSELAVKNIENIVTHLGYNLHTFVMDWEEFRDLQKSYFKASVVDVEVPTDQLIFAALNKIAYKYRIKFILAGNNVATESINPDGWVYKDKLDLVNLKSIHKKFGSVKLQNLPRLGLLERYFYEAVSGIQIVNLLDLVSYNKGIVKENIQNKLGWKDYGGKHFESIFTRFYQGYYLPIKFNIDKRKSHFSNLILSGQMSRTEALNELSKPTYPLHEQLKDRDYVIKKLGFTVEEWEEIMKLPAVPHSNFDTEKTPMHQAFYFIFKLLMFVPVRILRFLRILHTPTKINAPW